MWKTPDGRANTVALPDPTGAMTGDFAESVRGLGPDARSELAALVNEAQEEFFELLDDIKPTEPKSPEEDGLPREYLCGSFYSAAGVALYLTQIDVRWRLDALLAVEDYIDDLDAAEPSSWFAKLLALLRR